MEHTHLGRTGLLVSRLCLGTMNFGPETSEEDSHTIMDRALDEGVNFFDTANVYGWQKGEGVTEQIVGRWFAKGGGRRDKVVLATKLYGSMGDWPNETKLSALNIRRACEASLRRMQTDHIDLYQMHHVDRDTPWEEIWQAMDLLVQQGKVLYVGSSNFAGWHIVKANEAARRRGSLGLVSEQSLYNLFERSIELEVLPACRDYGVGVIPWSPLAGGMLGGILRKAREGRSASDQVRKRLEAAPGPGRGVRGVLRRAGRAALRRGPGLAAAPAGRDRADHRPPDPRAAGALAARPRGRAGRQGAGPPRPDLARPGRPRPRGVRVVRT